MEQVFDEPSLMLATDEWLRRPMQTLGPGSYSRLLGDRYAGGRVPAG